MEGRGKRVHGLAPGKTVLTEGVTDDKYGFYCTTCSRFFTVIWILFYMYALCRSYNLCKAYAEHLSLLGLSLKEINIYWPTDAFFLCIAFPCVDDARGLVTFIEFQSHSVRCSVSSSHISHPPALGFLICFSQCAWDVYFFLTRLY